jgi:hypothetical protein
MRRKNEIAYSIRRERWKKNKYSDHAEEERVI